MGIGLVHPILEPIADNLDATASQVSLLFTSYMAMMGVAMLITGVVGRRIGSKRTLSHGLVVIIAGAGLAGMSDRRWWHRRLQHRFGTVNVLIVNLLALSATLGAGGTRCGIGCLQLHALRRSSRGWPASSANRSACSCPSGLARRVYSSARAC